jgi:hypothetical protein
MQQQLRNNAKSPSPLTQKKSRKFILFAQIN